MSGSVHETRSSFQAARTADFSRAEAHEDEIGFGQERLSTKRDIKRTVRAERMSGKGHLPELPFQSADDLSITVVGDRNHYFHPLDVDATRELLSLLPTGTLDGLSAIEFRLGAGPFDAETDYPDPDPISGRRGIELLPGMWWQQVLGTHFRKNVIHIYAVAADDAKIPLLAQERQLARLIAANTLLHEVSHHIDPARRVARGRWRMDNTLEERGIRRNAGREMADQVWRPISGAPSSGRSGAAELMA